MPCCLGEEGCPCVSAWLGMGLCLCVLREVLSTGTPCESCSRPGQRVILSSRQAPFPHSSRASGVGPRRPGRSLGQRVPPAGLAVAGGSDAS